MTNCSSVRLVVAFGHLDEREHVRRGVDYDKGVKPRDIAYVGVGVIAGRRGQHLPAVGQDNLQFRGVDFRLRRVVFAVNVVQRGKVLSAETVTTEQRKRDYCGKRRRGDECDCLLLSHSCSLK